jgi:hypothetical protein
MHWHCNVFCILCLSRSRVLLVYACRLRYAVQFTGHATMQGPALCSALLPSSMSDPRTKYQSKPCSGMTAWPSFLRSESAGTRPDSSTMKSVSTDGKAVSALCSNEQQCVTWGRGRSKLVAYLSLHNGRGGMLRQCGLSQHPQAVCDWLTYHLYSELH